MADKTSRLLEVAAGLLVLAAAFLPLWRCTLTAPQYPDEPIRIVVKAGKLGGDLEELGHLNQYIGVHLPKELPEIDALSIVLPSLAGLLVLVALLRGRAGVWARRVAVVAAFGAVGWVLVSAYQHLYALGHTRHAHAPIAGFPDFTPPLIGWAKIGNFHVVALPAIGGWLLAVGLACAIASSIRRTAS